METGTEAEIGIEIIVGTDIEPETDRIRLRHKYRDRDRDKGKDRVCELDRITLHWPVRLLFCPPEQSPERGV